MGREVPFASDAEPVLACNLCGGVEHRPLSARADGDLVRCVGCGLVFVGAALGIPERSGTGAWPTASSRLARGHLRILRRSSNPREGLRLLDIGSPGGPFPATARSAGFDVEEVEAADWQAAGHPDGRFDVVTLFDMIGSVADPLSELATIRRMLRPGGLLLQSTPNIDGLLPRRFHVLASRLGHWPYRPGPPRQLYWFSDRTLPELTERAGYEVTRIDHARIAPGDMAGPAARSVMWLAAIAAPVAIAGPWFGKGDRLYLASRRPA